MSDQPKHITIKLDELRKMRKHWTRALLPQPTQQRINSISDEIGRGTKLPPGYVVEDKDGAHWLVAGETRRLAHMARQRDMQFIIITEDEAVNVALGENNNRQGYQFKYQTAWIYCPLALRVIEESKKQQLQNLKNAPKSTERAISALSTDLPTTIEQVADLIHVSRRLLVDVIGIYRNAADWDLKNNPRKFGDDKKTKSAMEFIDQKVRDEEAPCSPGQAWAGIAGSDAAAAGKTKPEPKQLQLFLDGFGSVGKWGKNFTKFTGEAKKQALEAIKKTALAWPKELRSELLSELKRIEREEKESAQ